MSNLRKTWRPAIFTAALAGCIGLAFTAVSVSPAQRSLGPQAPQSPQGFPGASPTGGPPGLQLPEDRENPVMKQMEKRQAIARNDDRQKELVKDTNKLLALATELKGAVDKTNKDTLSIDVIKKADEIAKLAKSVRDKMKAD